LLRVAGREVIEKFGWECGEVAGLPLHEEREAWLAGNRCRLCAGLAAGVSVLFVLGGRVGLDAAGDEELLDLFFGAVGGGVGDAAEVFDGVEAGGCGGDGNADGGERRGEQVGAVRGAVHPGLVGCGGAGRGAGYVFGDGAEVCAGLVCAGYEIWFAGILVLGWTALPGHDGEVSVRCAGKSRVPGEGWEIVLGAGLVGEDQEELLVGGLGVGWCQEGEGQE
jgi:hypothetical protein